MKGLVATCRWTLSESHFGYRDFLPGQKEAVETVLSDRGTVIIRPTGAGKSLCYQLPALLIDGLAVVISPLISLMTEQVERLKRLGIGADFLSHQQSPLERQGVHERVESGHTKLLYFAPERFQSPSFCRWISQFEIGLLAVDEAHCISEWGHDFRPHYRMLGEAIQHLSPTRIVATTATASPQVIRDIQTELNLSSGSLLHSGFHRDNLCLSTLQVTSEIERMNVILELLERNKPLGRVIIYASSRKKTERIARQLREEGIQCLTYHAGLSDDQRAAHQASFERREASVLAATSAFGMGIDLPDIRLVIHESPPRSIAQYYQEVGRAGRDGMPAGALLIYRNGDFSKQRFLIRSRYPNICESRELYRTLQASGCDGCSEWNLFEKAKRLAHRATAANIKCCSTRMQFYLNG